jgi:type IV pilus assembly protein PilC
MKNKSFGAAWLSSFCMELYLVMEAGIPFSEGIAMLGESETDRRAAAVLSGVYENLESGGELHGALRECGAFPAYMTDLLEIGGRTGRLDTALKALSEYYDRQERLYESIRNAVLYPAVLLAMLLFVVVVLITKVLPIFNDVFRQLGGTMSGAALAVMRFGTWLEVNWMPLVLALAVLAAAALLLPRSGRVRAWMSFHGPYRRLSAEIATARLAAAMAMTMRSGLDADESLEMAARLVKNPAVRRKLERCRTKLSEGGSFAAGISAAGVFEPLYIRMLSVGFRTGSSDSVMAEIARRCEEKTQGAIERAVHRVEPTLVIIMSVLVGLILLSVMLPLMGIMSGLG